MTLGMTTTEGTQANNLSTDANQELSTIENNSINDGQRNEGLANEDNAAVKEDELGKDGNNTKEGLGNDDEVKIPEKFLNKDGTPNIKALAKSYNELEPVRNKYAELTKQNEELSRKAGIAERLEQQQLEIAKTYGFNSVDEMQKHQQKIQADSEIAKFEANQYAQFLNMCESPEDARDLLVLYAQNPTPELLKAIEEEFPVEVHKQVTEKMVELKSTLKNQNAKMEYDQETIKVKSYLENVTTNHPEVFKNKEFVTLYGEAFKALGTEMDSDLFINLTNEFKKSVINEYVTSQNQNKENNDVIKAIESLSPNSQPLQGVQEKDVLSMTPEEIKKELKKYK